MKFIATITLIFSLAMTQAWAGTVCDSLQLTDIGSESSSMSEMMVGDTAMDCVMDADASGAEFCAVACNIACANNVPVTAQSGEKLTFFDGSQALLISESVFVGGPFVADPPPPRS
jgi:hypothetical protein